MREASHSGTNALACGAVLMRYEIGMNAPLPSNESERLAALRQYRVLDTAAEQAFDDITSLASFICGCPIALVSLIDEDRQWFKSRVGLDATETARELAFCAHAILAEGTMVVPDATKDQRFADNPLVLSEPKIRFYAGAPLITSDGHALGTLCVIDQKPRPLAPEHRKALEVLARQVSYLLELRRTSDRLAAAMESIRTLNALLPMCAYCRRIRDDAGYWEQLEDYVCTHAGSDFSHGICPDCAKTHFPQFTKPPTAP